MLSERTFHHYVEDYKQAPKHPISLFPAIKSNFLAGERLLGIGGGKDR
jgi:hypothetical protein